MFRDAIIKSLRESPKDIHALAADTNIPASVLRSTLNSLTTKQVKPGVDAIVVNDNAPVRVTTEGVWHLAPPPPETVESNGGHHGSD